MKYFYLFLWIALFVLLLILYFQLLAGAVFPVLFFTEYIMIDIWALFLSLIALLCGVFMTLGIKWFLDNNSDIDDWFDL